MLNKFFSLLYKLLIKCHRAQSLKNAIQQGMKVGQKTKFVGTQVFGSEPYLISIGSNCLLTDNIAFNTHDGGIQVPLISEGSDLPTIYSRYSLVGRVELGDNVFVGTRTIFLPNTKVGSNVVIAAGSVVKGDIPSNIVIGGVPAREICTIEDYYEKHINNLLIINNTNLSLDSKKKLVIEHLLK
ncbi:acyltransferase [Litorilituus lipolyticus]|uniref:Acyltransferase n=1 Tax=Litorilituus lipolyticus TaxID=2491017 RepID=A0A502L780_9GAMM|nr:acyltransferase [Litorilituus lipolyticus]TPH18954.1 acyltransferase [Litorilituus lipolyticus]